MTERKSRERLLLVLLVVVGVIVVCGCIALTGAPPGMSGERM